MDTGSHALVVEGTDCATCTAPTRFSTDDVVVTSLSKGEIQYGSQCDDYTLVGHRLFEDVDAEIRFSLVDKVMGPERGRPVQHYGAHAEIGL